VRPPIARDQPIRIGVLGCADVLKESLLDPLPGMPGFRFTAIASRSAERARAFAEKHGVPRHFGSYDALLADPGVDLVYVPLPNGLHCEWTLRALAAGRPVLCQKPLAANADQARRMVEAAQRTGLPLIEAWHYRYHPVARRIEEIVRSGVLGRLRSVRVRFKVPARWVIAGADNIRFQYELAGGALMDPGCYGVDLMRAVVREEPRVVRAQARLLRDQVDIAMAADLRFPGGCEGRLEATLDDPGDDLIEDLVAEGERGRLEVDRPFMPYWGENRIRVSIDGETREERLETTPTFGFMYREIESVLRDGAPIRTPADQGLANLEVMDAIYRAAGLRIRGG